MPAWLLPDQIADLLPNEAAKLEQLRRSCLDTAKRHGYELVAPSMLEYVDSLLTGTGRDLDLRTFKLTDQMSGKTLGLRADITPQVARIDAHLLNREGITRLCYAGSVLHTRAANALNSREQLQFGAEIYGDSRLSAEQEAIHLLLDCLAQSKVNDIMVDIGDVRVVEALLAQASISAEAHDDMLHALQAKDSAEIRAIAAREPALSPAVQSDLLALCQLWGDAQVLDELHKRFAQHAVIARAFDDVKQLTAALAKLNINVNIDFADLRGYHYYTASTFKVYVPGLQTALARGGRYDAVGAAFGRERPAVGFSMDLKQLCEVSGIASAP